MAYVSLYRKWRPQSFDQVVGQESIVKTLENSLNAGRISHAYLFTGPRGTGKTTVARILAKGLNCEQGPTAQPCGICGECQAIADGTSLNVVEIDGASNRGIDDVRELRGQVQFTPVNARYKVYIIDEVHMLTTEAFNALLKTLEEPPAHVVFIFATTDPQRLPLTILSRVQRYDFERFTQQHVVNRLAVVADGEGFSAHREGLELIAEHAGGSMRDALGILEKCAAFAQVISAESVAEVLGIAPGEQVNLFARHLLASAKGEALEIIDELYDQGRDLGQFVRAVIAKLRQQILQETADEAKCLQAMEVLSQGAREMRFAADPRLVLEVAVLKITTTAPAAAPTAALTPQPAVGELEAKIQALEKRIAKLQAQLAKGQLPTAEEKQREPQLRAPQGNDQERTAFILEHWLDYLSRLRAERLMQCEAFLKEGSPVAVKGSELIVAFPRDRGFHKASIEQDNHREPAERVLSKLMGVQMQLRCVFADEEEAPRVPQAAPQQASAKQQEPAPEEKPKSVDKAAEEFLRVSMETFGGRIISKPKGN